MRLHAAASYGSIPSLPHSTTIGPRRRLGLEVPDRRRAWRRAPPRAGQPGTTPLITLHEPGRNLGDPVLVRKRTRNGHEITLHYDARARLEWVRDSGGRIIRFEHDQAGRLTLVSLPHPTQPGWVPHTRYVYSREGDLVEVLDPLGHATRYEYAGHLLVRETDRTGLSFYFGYDGNGPGAYCIRTWGDGGIYDHEIDYDKSGRVTYVTNSLDATTTYEMNVANAVVKVTDACGGQTRYEYDDNLWKTAEIDPLGNTTRYEYDERGSRTKVVGPDGAKIEIAYNDQNLPARAEDPCGGEWRWRYDEQSQLVERRNPLGEATRYEHRGGQLVAVIDAAGRRTQLAYDDEKNLQVLRLPNGAEESYQHDGWGRVIASRDARGNVQRQRHDACSRLVTIEEPDGNVRRLAYDGEGNVLEAQDHHRHVRFTYGGYNKLVRREEAGGTVQIRHDTEDQILAIENEAGEVYQFERDRCGRVQQERGFDGPVTTYSRDAAGRVTKIRKPSGRTIDVAYDPASRLASVRRSDGTTERWSYRADGALVEASNEAATIRFERDALGRVVREGQGPHWIDSRFHAGGERVRVASSLGADVGILHDAMGNPATVAVGGDLASWQVSFGRDGLGLETERRLPGGVTASWERDRLGRPAVRRVNRGGTPALPELEYRWEQDDRLSALIDAARGPTLFQHDARARLVSAQHPDGRVEHRAPDAVGNLYRDPSRRDRVYGPGGELREAGGTQYRHDADGNLIEKLTSEGARWTYAWDAAGQLREVTRPDGRKVTFAYDALGRRVAKRYGDQETRWIWDGDVPLHELSSLEGPVTWIFEPESFAPLGRLQGARRHAIVTDHLGTPAAMFDDAGEIAWRAQLDLYGATKADVARTPCPWRWPGQYEDEETGLYYNRFRYYDPEAGRYISQDPIGLAGGTDLYGYVPDSLTWTDPLGLTDVEKIYVKTLKQAMQRAADFAKVPRISKGGIPIPLDMLNTTSRGPNFLRMSIASSNRTKVGKTPLNLGRMDERTGAKFELHPDGHPDMPDDPHHLFPHVHAKNAKGQAKIFVVGDDPDVNKMGKACG